MSLEQELETAIQLARTAGNAVMPLYLGNLEIKTKEDKSPVTQADVLANHIILEGIQQAFPGDGVISEELASVDGERYWYVDPIDGTRGFINRSGEFAIHIGLCEDQRPVLGVIYRPLHNELYFGSRREGAYLETSNDKQPLQVSTHQPQKLRLVLPRDFFNKPNVRQMVGQFGKTEIITSGSEGLRIMKLAENYGDIHFNEHREQCSTWDLCAPQAILEAAGGHILSLGGQEILYQQQNKLNQFFIATRTREQMDYAQEKLEYLLENL